MRGRACRCFPCDPTTPEGVRLEVAGEVKESAGANQALLRSVPIGLLMLIFFLMFEFNSFRKVGLIVATLPLAAVGVIPGLVIGQQPFGFMSLLGVITLVGIAVNNAIVLLDCIDTLRAGGASHEEAVQWAVKQRCRPILLTTATTIAGMLPLALSETTLWPPMAWATISGLAASTMLTLAVFPALCLVALRPKHPANSRATSHREQFFGGEQLGVLGPPSGSNKNQGV